MKAYVIDDFGNADMIMERTVPTPKVQKDMVLVQVKATSVNPIDTKIRSGAVQIPEVIFPKILHGDFSGIIIDVGSDVTDFNVGDEVVGFSAAGGALGEFMLVDPNMLAKKPQNLSFAEGAGFPLGALASWLAMVDKGRLTKADHILIHGGTGGVGHMAVQIAKAIGAEVSTTVTGAENISLVSNLGVDHVIDYQKENVLKYVHRLTHGHGFDLVFDTVGGGNIDVSFEGAKVGGVVTTIAARSTHDLSPMHNKALTLHASFTMIGQFTPEGRAHHGEILRQVSKWIEEGKIKVLLDDKSFTMENIREAHEYYEAGKVKKGKLIVEW